MKESLSSPPGSAALGVPIPCAPHALSVSLPSWQDNVYWAEGNPKVVDVMSTGYPRFFVHRSIQKLAKICLDSFKNDEDMAMLFPTARTGEECISLLKRYMPADIFPAVQLVHFKLVLAAEVGGEAELHAVLFPPDHWRTAKSFWQHAGMGISSRYADRLLEALASGHELCRIDRPLLSLLNAFPGALREKSSIKCRLANMANGGDGILKTPIPDGPDANGKHFVTEDHVYLYPTGMSAIWHAHQLSLTFKPNCKSICFGFSYTDTIKILERWGPGSVKFFEDPNTNLTALEEFLPGSSVTALFCEVPSNPLLQSPNLLRVRELADKYGFLIVVDDTVGTFINVDVLQYADIVATSMSKLISGSANVMGGSLVINPNSQHFTFLRDHLSLTFVDDYYHEDVVVMEGNSRDFAARVQVINTNTEAVCDYLRTRSLAFGGPESSNPLSDHAKFVIKDVFYPKWVARENYDLCRRRNSSNNFGPLFSLTFTTSAASHAFYNALQCAKGPSLGTNFTLSCPYTILAHYNEREWAAGYGIEEGIVRISVGMEERDEVLAWMEIALSAAEETRRTCLLP
ncbi:hypothetical protein M0805_004887 [Coniferiporia weirii]|nr:hypothetical protein M0805_004887 [Coniferiporia weirii]